MEIQSRIIKNIPVFKLGDSLKEVIKFFKNTTYSHVAVTDEGQFIGLLSENDLETFEGAKKIEDHRYSLESCLVSI
jgi:predicted transcriptional regulator